LQIDNKQATAQADSQQWLIEYVGNGLFRIVLRANSSVALTGFANDDYESDSLGAATDGSICGTNYRNLEADFAQYFIEGLSLFYSGFVFDCDIFRDMEDSFGILPPPKYDTAQKDYNTKVRAPNMLVGIPTTVPESEYDFVGSVTEALACESYLTVRGIVYETVLKNKYLRNVDSEEMLDLVTKNIGIDLGYVYAPWNLRFPVWQILEKKSKDFASFYASNEKNAIAELDKAIEALTKNEN